MTAGPLSVRPHVRTDSKAGAGAGENDEYLVMAMITNRLAVGSAVDTGSVAFTLI
jgi:hypothetical protein